MKTENFEINWPILCVFHEIDWCIFLRSERSVSPPNFGCCGSFALQSIKISANSERILQRGGEHCLPTLEEDTKYFEKCPFVLTVSLPTFERQNINVFGKACFSS